MFVQLLHQLVPGGTLSIVDSPESRKKLSFMLKENLQANFSVGLMSSQNSELFKTIKASESAIPCRFPDYVSLKEKYPATMILVFKRERGNPREYRNLFLEEMEVEDEDDDEVEENVTVPFQKKVKQKPAKKKRNKRPQHTPEEEEEEEEEEELPLKKGPVISIEVEEAEAEAEAEEREEEEERIENPPKRTRGVLVVPKAPYQLFLQLLASVNPMVGNYEVLLRNKGTKEIVRVLEVISHTSLLSNCSIGITCYLDIRSN